MVHFYKRLSSLFVLLFCIYSLNGQLDFDPCAEGNGPGCQSGGANRLGGSAQDTVGINQKFMIIAGGMDSTSGKIDTTHTGTMTVSKISGPGELLGMTIVAIQKWALFPDLTLDKHGLHTLKISDGNFPDYEVSIFVDSNYVDPHIQPGGPATRVSIKMHQQNFPADRPFDFVVIAEDDTGGVDINYNAHAVIEKLKGPGDIMVPDSMPFQQGVADFRAVMVNAPGEYQFRISSGSLKPDTSIVFHAQDPDGGNNGGGHNEGDCNQSTKGERTNLGLYGGASLDLSFNEDGRLFAAISTPASLFASDDSAQTWYACFPSDSLEYDCDRGWGGRAMQVLTNQSGWVGVLTSQEAGTLTSSVISYQKGDTGTWQTAIDGVLLEKLGYQRRAVRAMDLSDHHLFAACSEYIVMVNSNGRQVINIHEGNNSVDQQATVRHIAAANSLSGYPIYAIISTSQDVNAKTGELIKLTESDVSTISIPQDLNGVSSVFTAPHQISGDTLFVSGFDNSQQTKIYKSYDGGQQWQDITPQGMMGGWSLSDVDYSESWKTQVPEGDGIALIIPGSFVSFDLGVSWRPIGLTNNGGAVHPGDTAYVVGTRGRGVAISTNGPSGPYEIAENYGLEAVKVNQIARSSFKGVFYIATSAGLAYTTAYLNDQIVGSDKWISPNGEFPVNNAGDDAGVSAVAVDPWDSTHVIAGYSNGFIVSHSGVGGFQNVNPQDWHNSPQKNPRVQDIAFITSKVVVAVTGGDNQAHSGQGNIWRSTDGGDNWAIVTPSGQIPFSSGNTVAVAYGEGDTVVYVGTGIQNTNNPSDKGMLWKSADKGENWSFINNGPDSYNGPMESLPILDIAIDPRGTDTLYLAAGSNLDNSWVTSKDGGASYTYIKGSGEGAFTSVMVNEDNPDTVYAAIRRDILMYVKPTEEVFRIFRGLPGELVPDLVYGSVLAGTNTGLFSVEVNEEDFEVVGSIAPKNENSNLRLYPNPVRNELRIESFSENIQLIQVYDLTGKLVSSFEVDDRQVNLNISRYLRGLYFVEVHRPSGTHVEKILKKD